MSALDGDVAPGGWLRRGPDSLSAGGKQKPAFAEDQDAETWRKQSIGGAGVQAESSILSRRGFLTGGAALAASTAVDWQQPGPFTNFLGKPLGELDYHSEVNEFKQILERNYGIKLIMGPQPDQKRVTGDMVLLEKYKSVMEVIAQELSYYPPEMIREIGKGRTFEIRIIDNLYQKGPFAGLQSSDDAVKITAVAQPIAKDGMARLSLEADKSQAILRRTIHHELNHFFAAKWENWEKRNEKWVAFHEKISPNPYEKVPPGTTVQAPAPPEKRYCLTYYASAAAQEDEGVCAEWMMTPLLHFEFRHRIDNEEDKNVRDVLLAKYNQTIENYRIWSRGKIDKPFWEAIYRQGEKEYVRMAKSE